MKVISLLPVQTKAVNWQARAWLILSSLYTPRYGSRRLLRKRRWMNWVGSFREEDFLVVISSYSQPNSHRPFRRNNKIIAVTVTNKYTIIHQKCINWKINPCGSLEFHSKKDNSTMQQRMQIQWNGVKRSKTSLLRSIKCINVGSCHKYIFCRDNSFSRQEHVCRDKTRLLSRQKYAWRDKTFLATNIILSWQA